MSVSAAATAASVTGPCPCGLTKEEVINTRLFKTGGVCTAFRIGSNREECGKLIAEHPTTGTISLFFPITLFIFINPIRRLFL